MLGLTELLTEKVQNLRVRELKFSKWARKLLCLRVLLGTDTSLWCKMVRLMIIRK